MNEVKLALNISLSFDKDTNGKNKVKIIKSNLITVEMF